MVLNKIINGINVEIEITEEDLKSLKLQKQQSEAPKKVLFELTMPNRNSYNGKWTGDEKKHYLIINKSKVGNIDDILKTSQFFYDFKDGWKAEINVKLINNYEARIFNKNNDGFCGYDWMVSNIIKNCEI
jgi:sporulation protein YlmC with PRC-barrel domain